MKRGGGREAKMGRWRRTMEVKTFKKEAEEEIKYDGKCRKEKRK
jgi:hypothetical protein